MFVRPLNPDEVLSALHLIWEVYASDVAPLQNPGRLLPDSGN